MNVLFTIEYKNLYSSNGNTCPSITLTIQSIYFEHLIHFVFEHMSLWYAFLEPYQITYHSNIGVLVRKLTKQGLFCFKHHE